MKEEKLNWFERWGYFIFLFAFMVQWIDGFDHWSDYTYAGMMAFMYGMCRLEYKRWQRRNNINKRWWEL